MIRVFFVDDEALVRKAIVQSVDWSQHGAVVIGEAGNGKEALESPEISQSDLVITDIRMPIMDGLELQKQLKERFPHIRVAIVSGYDDFEYAREALRLGACGYLLKPVSEEDLLTLLKEVQAKIELERQRDTSQRASGKLVRENILYIRSRFMLDIMEGREPLEEKSVDKAEQLGISLRGPLYGVVVVKPDEYHPLFSDEQGEKLQSFAIHNMVEELFPSSLKSAVIYGESNTILILFQGRKVTRTHMYEILRKMQQTIEEVFGVSTSFAVTEGMEKLANLQLLYTRAMDAMESRFYGEKGGIYYETGHNDTTDTLWNAERLSFEHDFLKTFRNGQYEEALGHLDRAIEFFGEKRVPSYVCQEYAVYLVHEMLDYLVSLGGSLESCGEKIYSQNRYVPEIRQISFLQELYGFLKDTVIFVKEQVMQMAELKYSRMIRLALQHLEHHYNEFISLTDLAERLDVSANYLSKVFKKEVGVNYVDWLNRLRIEKAKELLMEKTYKVYEVADLVGYSEYKYFITMFKKYTGMTPKQFREQLVGNSAES